jgi:hypothetical protein
MLLNVLLLKMPVHDVFHYTRDIKGRTFSYFIYVLLLGIDTKFHAHTNIKFCTNISSDYSTDTG